MADQPKSISEFVSDVLSQLSPTAWLPSATVVLGTAFFLELSAHGDHSIKGALGSLTERPLATFVLLGVAVLLVGLILQAFSFTLIRFAEGYWDPLSPLGGICSRCIKRKERQRRALEQDLVAATRAAIEDAASGLRLSCDGEVSAEEIISYQSIGGFDPEIPHPREWSDREHEIAALNWAREAPPEQLRRIDALAERLARMPEGHRVLPTKLGNTLRSHEDAASGILDEGIEVALQRDYERLSPPLDEEHDYLRSRLDLYVLLACCLTMLAPIGLVVLNSGLSENLWTVLLVALAPVLGWLAARAAVAVADDYGHLLEVIADYLERTPDSSAVAGS